MQQHSSVTKFPVPLKMLSSSSFLPSVILQLCAVWAINDAVGKFRDRRYEQHLKWEPNVQVYPLEWSHGSFCPPTFLAFVWRLQRMLFKNLMPELEIARLRKYCAGPKRTGELIAFRFTELCSAHWSVVSVRLKALGHGILRKFFVALRFLNFALYCLGHFCESN